MVNLINRGKEFFITSLGRLTAFHEFFMPNRWRKPGLLKCSRGPVITFFPAKSSFECMQMSTRFSYNELPANVLDTSSLFDPTHFDKNLSFSSKIIFLRYIKMLYQQGHHSWFRGISYYSNVPNRRVVQINVLNGNFLNFIKHTYSPNKHVGCKFHKV